jgi:hypothetical protein
MKIDLKANEMVVKAADTNHLVNESGKIKGKLILTNQRIYFKGLNGNAGTYDMEIEPNNIRDVLFFNPGFLQFNGLNLVTKQGTELKFIIKQRNTWGHMIANMC